MKPKSIQQNDNCIATPSTCVLWNGGSIESLGICNGDMLPKVIWEIATKLEELAGEDISQFDIEKLLDICGQKAPREITLISILELIRDNQVCLKDYIKAVEDVVNSLSSSNTVEVNLKCFAEFDSQGNGLGVTRATFDQLVIDKLCNHETRISDAEGKITLLNNTLSDMQLNPVVVEPEFSTCVNPTVASTSVQAKANATEICAIRDDIGTTTDINSAIAQVPDVWGTPEFAALLAKYELTGFIPGVSFDTLAPTHQNTFVTLALLQKQIAQILSTCCAPSCDKIKIGFTGTFDYENSLLTLNFTRSAGTFIPDGFVDCGTTITITDRNGISVNVYTDSDAGIEMDGSIEDIDIQGLATGQLLVSFKTNFCLKDATGATIMNCQDCTGGTLNYINNKCCAITNTGTDPVTITIKTCSS